MVKSLRVGFDSIKKCSVVFISLSQSPGSELDFDVPRVYYQSMRRQRNALGIGPSELFIASHLLSSNCAELGGEKNISALCPETESAVPRAE
jgi:hypothetical protein